MKIYFIEYLDIYISYNRNKNHPEPIHFLYTSSNSLIREIILCLKKWYWSSIDLDAVDRNSNKTYNILYVSHQECRCGIVISSDKTSRIFDIYYSAICVIDSTLWNDVMLYRFCFLVLPAFYAYRLFFQ